MLGLLNAERIKLTSTRSPWWCAAVVALFGLAIPILVAFVAKHDYDSGNSVGENIDAALAMMGVFTVGIYVLMIMATLAITNEYRFGIIRTTFLAAPNRPLVLAAKSVVLGVFAIVVTLLVGLVSLIAIKAILPSELSQSLEFSGTTWKVLFGGSYYMLLCVVLAIAVGALLRHTAAAISLLILWPLAAETLLSQFGSFGHTVRPFLPFANAAHFFGDTGIEANWHWGDVGGIVYFTVFVLLVCAGAVFSITQRDA